MADAKELAAAMDRLWAQFLPQIVARINALESAASAAAAGTLTASEREHAFAEAHKLAGVLGTFGLPQGTELAREAETVYASGAGIDAAAAQRLAGIAAQLHSIVASRA